MCAQGGRTTSLRRRVIAAVAVTAVVAALIIACRVAPGTYRVVDVRTGRPISGASAVLYKDTIFPGPYPSVPPPFEILEEIRCDADGYLRFSRWAEAHLIGVTSPGYKRTRWDLYLLFEEGPQESGTIKMRRIESDR